MTNRFDVYVRQAGRWQRLQSFAEVEKDAALNLAQGADQEDGVDGVRVMEVRDYGPDRSPVEVLAWISPHLAKRIRRAPSASKGPPVPSAATSADQAGRDAARARAAKLRDRAPDAAAAASATEARPTYDAELERPRKAAIAGRLALTLVLAAGLSLAALVPARMAIGEVVSAGLLSAGAIPAVTLGSVAFLFVVALLGFLPAVVGRDNLRALISSADPEPVRAVTVSRGVDEDADEDEDEADGEGEPDEETSPEPSAGDGAEVPPPAAKKPEQGLSEDSRIGMMRFLEATLMTLKDDVPRMDQLTNFGLCLFLAGAGTRFGKEKTLNTVQTFIVVREAIEAVGTPADRVERFSQNYMDYREDSAYRTMIDAGDETMARYLADDETAFGAVADTMRRWKRSPAAVARLSGILTVMFTDLVGSTSMTQQMGDHGAQRIVRAHNAIVRGALAAHHGEEVKHTGDGIMASFANAAQAVRATIQIQRDVLAQREGKGGLPLRIRIGLNSGDAVKEESDLFGTAVQLAARVCDKADADQIFVTNTVIELSATQGFGFRSVGELTMKGIDDPVPVYEVLWRESG